MDTAKQLHEQAMRLIRHADDAKNNKARLTEKRFAALAYARLIACAGIDEKDTVDGLVLRRHVVLVSAGWLALRAGLNVEAIQCAQGAIEAGESTEPMDPALIALLTEVRRRNTKPVISGASRCLLAMSQCLTAGSHYRGDRIWTCQKR